MNTGKATGTNSFLVSEEELDFESKQLIRQIDSQNNLIKNLKELLKELL